MLDPLNSAVDRTSANHGSRTVEAAAPAALRLSNFVAVTFAFSVSIFPSAKPTASAEALRLIVSLPFLMSILPLTCAEPLSCWRILAVEWQDRHQEWQTDDE